MTIFKKFTFDSAHFLPQVPVGHKCRNMNGHTYNLTLFVDDHIDSEMGWVMDFTDLKTRVKPIIEKVDHQLLNDIEGLQNPTAENLTIWLWEQIRKTLPQLVKIELMETPTSGVVYSGV